MTQASYRTYLVEAEDGEVLEARRPEEVDPKRPLEPNSLFGVVPLPLVAEAVDGRLDPKSPPDTP